MNSAAQHLSRFYDRILRLYPAGFRDEYAEEMRAVFQMQLTKQPVNFWLFIRIAWAELHPLPSLLIAAHWRERRKPPMKTGLERWFVQPEGSWKELALAGLPFVMFGLPGVFIQIPALMNLPDPARFTIIALMALTLISVGIIGLLVKLPRWSLVYAGALLSFCTLGGLAIIASFGNLPINWGNYFVTATFLGIHLGGLFLLVAAILWISGKIPLTVDFRQQVATDPSLISLMMYGGTMIVMLANFDDIPDDGGFFIAAFLILLLGLWGYLRTDKLRTQLLSLVIGVTAATGLGLAANLLLVNYNSPPVIIGGLEIERVVVFIALIWLTSLAMILLPMVVFREKARPAAA